MNAEVCFPQSIKFYYIKTKNKDIENGQRTRTIENGRGRGRQTSSPSYINPFRYNNKQEFIKINRCNNQQD